MAPTSLLEIAKEGFDLIDQFYGKNKYHQQPCAYHRPEIPLMTEKPPLYSQPIYYASRVQPIGFGTVNNPSLVREGPIYQYPNPNPKPKPRTQDYVGGDNNNNRRRDQADGVPSKDMVGGEPMTGQTKYSGKWKEWNVGLTRF